MLLDMVPQLRASEESALRRDHRDSITPLSNTAVHRKNVDDDILAESCYIRLKGWEIGEVATTLRCKCLSWAQGNCLGRSVFETGGYPTCRRSIFLIGDEIILGQAAADGDTEKLRRLLENGIQHSPRGLFGTTPLIQAAQNGQRETIRLLLEHGASIPQDEYQRTALHFASAGGHAEAADEPLLHGADTSPINKKGQTFLHLAVLSRSPNTVAVLLDKYLLTLPTSPPTATTPPAEVAQQPVNTTSACLLPYPTCFPKSC